MTIPITLTKGAVPPFGIAPAFRVGYLFFLICSSIHATININITSTTTKHVPKSMLFLLEL